MKSGLEHVEYDTHHNVANAAFSFFFLFSLSSSVILSLIRFVIGLGV